MDGARIVVLYHKENAQLPLVIHDIFGGAPEWLELDLASVDVHRTIMRLRAFVRAPDRDPSPVPMPMPVLLRHGNHRSGKKLIAALCTWSSKRLRVVIHCTEFVRGSFFSMTCNMDHIVAEKRGRRLLWPRALFEEFYDEAVRSTCGLVGIDLQRRAFAEYRQPFLSGARRGGGPEGPPLPRRPRAKA